MKGTKSTWSMMLNPKKETLQDEMHEQEHKPMKAKLMDLLGPASMQQLSPLMKAMKNKADYAKRGGAVEEKARRQFKKGM